MLVDLLGRLEPLVSTLARIEKERNAARLAVHEMKAQILALQWGVKSGGFVRYDAQVFQVVSVRTDYSVTEKPWVFGRLIKKDGTPEIRVHGRCLYNGWEVCPPPDNFNGRAKATPN